MNFPLVKVFKHILEIICQVTVHKGLLYQAVRQEARGWQAFSEKSQTVNILGIAGQNNSCHIFFYNVKNILSS